MSIKAILYDLDGTLLPMDTEKFVKIYSEDLAEKSAREGYDRELVMKGVYGGLGRMIENDGIRTNEEVFLDFFGEIFEGDELDRIKAVFMDYYENEFRHTLDACMPNEIVPQIVDIVNEKGIRQIVATNPLFPAVATRQRVQWTGCDIDSFELITTYENSGFSKPNIKYYEEILEKQGLKPEECLMVGNNTDEDMIAEELGMKVFLVTDELLNRSGKDISRYPNGSYPELLEFIKGI